MVPSAGTCQRLCGSRVANLSSDFQRCCRWIDPCRGRFCGWLWRFSDEALRVGAEGTIESFLACRVDRVDLAVMDLIGRHQAEAGMMVILIVPAEKAPAECLGVLDAAEALGELRLIFQGFEVAFRERVVVGGVGPAV